MNLVVKLLRETSGATSAEYALILAILGAVVATAAFGLGGAIGTALTDAGTCISSGGVAAC